MLHRGESLVAWTGLTLGALLLTSLAAMAWWTMHAHEQAQSQAHAQRVALTAELVARGVESLVSAGELSAARRLVLEAARDDEIAHCRVLLGDGRVLAADEPGRITAVTMPQTLPPMDAGVGARGTMIELPGGGLLVLEIEAAAAMPGSGLWRLQTGIAAIGACGFVALLVVYRGMRRRLGVMGMIRDALMAAARGEQDTQALVITEVQGPAAKAWNALLADRERLREHNTQERAGDALSMRHQRGGDLQDACDAMWQGLVIVDETLRIRYLNGAAAVFLQRPRDELAGGDLAKVVEDEELCEVIRGVVAGTIKQRRTIEIEHTEPAHGILRFHVRPVRRDDAGAAMIVIEDVTQQRVAEASRNAFVAQATHELRTPLTNIRLYVEEMLEMGEGDHAERAKSLNIINSESRRLERIVGDMLSVSEIEAGSLRLTITDMRLDRTLDELREDYKAQALSKGLELVFELPPKYPVFHADRDRLTLAMHNLIGNALKYTPAGGTVTVRVAADERELVFEVIDTGIGIDEADQPRIFERFYRAQDKRVEGITGSGLGLALARDVVRLHGGDITVESVLDEGTTFVMRVPNGAMSAAGDARAA